MNYKSIAEKIIEFSGGRENIADGLHCITRVRLYLKDNEKADITKLEKVEGVAGVQFKSGQFQVILGNHVNNVFNELDLMLNFQKSVEAPKKSRVLDNILDTIAQIFTPIIPAIVGAGIMKGVLSLLVTLKWIEGSGDTYTILNIISDAAFYFLPFLLAASASRRFRLNEFIGISLAGILMYPSILSMEAPMKFLNILHIPVVSYASSVLPIILGIWLMSYVYKYLDRIIPKTLRLVFTPLLTLTITVPIVLAFIGPIGTYMGSYVALASNYLFDKFPLIAGILVGGIYPLIIMTGMHYAYFPVLLQNLSSYGYDNGFFPVSLFSNIAQAGAVFAVALKTKNKQFRNVAISSGVSALLGITEPALYGVNLKLKKPLYAVMISGGAVSAVALSLGMRYFGFVAPGIAALPVTINPDGSVGNFIIALLGVAVSFVLAFGLTLVFGFEDVSEESEKLEDKKSASVDKESNFIISSPISGSLIPLEKVDDNTFSKEMVGKGVALNPCDNKIIAPFDGIITALIDTGHAMGLKSNDGIELLIHIGLETVNLKQNVFFKKIKVGDTFKRGDLLLEFNRSRIIDEGLSVVTPIIVTNSDEYLDVLTVANNDVKAGDKLLAAIK